jgi:hypothetical protein
VRRENLPRIWGGRWRAASLWRLPTRRFARGSQLVDDGAFRRLPTAGKLLGEIFELCAHGGFAVVGGDEVRPDGEQRLAAKPEQIAVEKQPVVGGFERLDLFRVGDVGRYGSLKKGIATDAGAPNEIPLLLTKMDGEEKE